MKKNFLAKKGNSILLGSGDLIKVSFIH